MEGTKEGRKNVRLMINSVRLMIIGIAVIVILRKIVIVTAMATAIIVLTKLKNLNQEQN